MYFTNRKKKAWSHYRILSQSGAELLPAGHSSSSPVFSPSCCKGFVPLLPLRASISSPSLQLVLQREVRAFPGRPSAGVRRCTPLLASGSTGSALGLACGTAPRFPFPGEVLAMKIATHGRAWVSNWVVLILDTSFAFYSIPRVTQWQTI